MAKLEIKKISTEFEVYASEKDLNDADQLLVKKAKEIALNAYAPYSNFKVGAALLLDNGKIITGNNQENAAYPSGLCAERTAAFYALAQYPSSKIDTIAVVSENSNFTEPLSPCGVCRQVLSEYELKAESSIRVIMVSGTGKIYVSASVENLLPLRFSAKYLK